MELCVRSFRLHAITSFSSYAKCRHYIAELLRVSLHMPSRRPREIILARRNFHLGCCSHASRTLNTTREIKKCCDVLGVSESCSQQELKDAFLKLARKYHPDSGSEEASASKFALVESTYRKARELLSFSTHEDVNEMLEKDFGIKHTVPQHRQYLSYDGIGHGTPSQRQHQYKQHKVTKATEAVYDYRIKKTTSQYENTLLLKDTSLARQYKTSQAIERLVEDLILESMSRGEFDNLPGSGKPLKYMPENPYVDHMTHKLNQILINNGFTPEWIALEKEIKEQKSALKATLVQKRAVLGPLPLSSDETRKWCNSVQELQQKCRELNFKIDKFNMIVPTPQKQLLHFQLKKEADKILSKVESNPAASKNIHPNNPQCSSSDGDGLFGMIFQMLK